MCSVSPEGTHLLDFPPSFTVMPQITLRMTAVLDFLSRIPDSPEEFPDDKDSAAGWPIWSW